MITAGLHERILLAIKSRFSQFVFFPDLKRDKYKKHAAKILDYSRIAGSFSRYAGLSRRDDLLWCQRSPYGITGIDVWCEQKSGGQVPLGGQCRVGPQDCPGMPSFGQNGFICDKQE
ncbi:hypothetical protein NDU88_003256 [Pleurodeles waltl]|uniref:Uncharacterized protein n=1 Tax=Pleurodeles waltl TaxID=8319 RepID=A0AAV7LI23_PLEWA|nr:hypothetical protein NDU88_003256 [Pleurodeles waltl]